MKSLSSVREERILRKLDRVFDGRRRVLDLGCGRGRFLRRLGERGIGVDGAESSISLCRQDGLDVRQVILPGILPFPGSSFDGVYCSHFIEHFSPREAHGILTEVDRVLSPGGTLVIRSPLFGPDFFDDPTHVRPYHLHAVLHLLGGWESPGSRQSILGEGRPEYELVSYQEEIYPFHCSTVAPTIAPRRFPFRLALRGLAYLLSAVSIGRRGAYVAVLDKIKGIKPGSGGERGEEAFPWPESSA